MTQVGPHERTAGFSREVLDAIEACTCVTHCDEDPQTACRLTGQPHVHPAAQGPGFGPCPVHPSRPGDH